MLVSRRLPLERGHPTFLNMALVAASAGATLCDAVRIVVYVTDMDRYRPLVNTVQEHLWGAGPYPPRTLVEVQRLNQDDIVEVEGTFYAPLQRASVPSKRPAHGDNVRQARAWAIRGWICAVLS